MEMKQLAEKVKEIKLSREMEQRIIKNCYEKMPG